MGKRYLTTLEQRDLFDMFEEGMALKDIVELSGRPQTTVSRYKRMWKEQKSEEAVEAKNASETKEEELTETLANSDYANRYMSDDPAVVKSSFEINHAVTIRSKKTDILYQMEQTSEEKTVKITLRDGQTINIELGEFIKFCDEGLDVYLELKKTA